MLSTKSCVTERAKVAAGPGNAMREGVLADFKFRDTAAIAFKDMVGPGHDGLRADGSGGQDAGGNDVAQRKVGGLDRAVDIGGGMRGTKEHVVLGMQVGAMAQREVGGVG